MLARLVLDREDACSDEAVIEASALMPRRLTRIWREPLSNSASQYRERLFSGARDIKTTPKRGGLLLGYNSWIAGTRLKAPTPHGFKPRCPHVHTGLSRSSAQYVSACAARCGPRSQRPYASSRSLPSASLNHSRSSSSGVPSYFQCVT